MVHPDAEMWWEAWNAYLTGRCIIKNSPVVPAEPSPEQQTIATLQRELEAVREMLQSFCTENPPACPISGKPMTFKQWVRSHSRDALAALDKLKEVR